MYSLHCSGSLFVFLVERAEPDVLNTYKVLCVDNCNKMWVTVGPTSPDEGLEAVGLICYQNAGDSSQHGGVH